MPDIVLRHYQAGCKPALIKHLMDHPGKHPVVGMPTGSGKTYAIADFVGWALSINKKVCVLSHVKEIIEQNATSLEKYLNIKVSVNSSMLGRREKGDITIAGIQSVYRKPEMFDDVDFFIVDECHLVNWEEGTMYEKFLSAQKDYVCIGFTATPFRLGSGYIYGPSPDTLFDHIAYDWTSTDQFNKLVDEGWLCPLVAKEPELLLDVEDVKLKGGDFNEKELSDKFDRLPVTNAAIAEVMKWGRNRNKWMIFAIDIDHAEHIAEVLIRNGISTAIVHSKMHEMGFDRHKIIKEIKESDKYKCVVNVNILTTGFDDPRVDLIACLRPTTSAVLHGQSLGRGSRIHPDKKNCLVLDFAGNTARLGPINDPIITKKQKTDGTGEAPTKTCPVEECKTILPTVTKICPECGHKFKFNHNLSAVASGFDIIEKGQPSWLPVTGVTYNKKVKFGHPSTIEVIYHCANRQVSCWVCIEHQGFAKHKADHWVKFRGGIPCNTAEDFLLQSNQLRVPTEVLVQKKGKYYVITDCLF